MEILFGIHSDSDAVAIKILAQAGQPSCPYKNLPVSDCPDVYYYKTNFRFSVSYT